MQTTSTTQPKSTPAWVPARSPLLQRKCACGNSAGLTGECSECQKEKLTLQRRMTHSDQGTEVPAIVHEVLNSPGQSLEPGTRTLMESRFGQDFSQVRVHTNDQAQRSARAVNALAYAVGNNVVFGTGQYSPHTLAGQKTLAHELTHTLQQRSMSNPAIATLKVGSANDSYEREAETQAEKVVSINEAIAPPTQRYTSAVQRLGDLAKVPPGLPCPIASSGAPLETDHILFPNRGVTLSPLQQAQIENVVRNWRAAGASTPVRVDGFASQVGADELNWQLSCDRVLAVAAELMHPSSGEPGIPSSFIATFAQGETNEFGSDPENRRVNIFTPIPSVPPTPTPTPTPTTPRVVPCSPMPTQIFSRGGCGGGTDFTNHDFQSLAGASAAERAAVWEADNLTFDFQLRNRMRVELGLLAGSEGTRMVTHFSGGTGSQLTHGSTSPLGSDALSSATFLGLHRAVIQEIESELARMHIAGVIDCNAIAPPNSAVPSVSFGFGDSFALKGIIGGTQGLRIRIIHFSANPGLRGYTIGLQYLICDDFGVDTADLYSPALVAFWVLQHRRTGHLPFINELNLPMSESGSY
jgi:outer membrane protein OmpA-like peptidoglycan-associated protein